MSNDDDGLPFPCQSLQRLLYISFRRSIQGRGRLVENQDFRFFVEGSGNSDALPLVAGQGNTVLADVRIIPIGKPLNELFQPQLLRQIHNPLHVRVQITDGNILRHRTGKQFNLLRHRAYPAAQAPVVNLLNIIITDANASRLDRINVLEKRDQGSLARTTFTYDGGRFSLLNLQVHPLEHLLTRTVTEENILKRDIPNHIRLQYYLPVIVLFALQIHDLEKAVGGNQGILNGLVGRNQKADGRNHVAYQGIEHHQGARCQFPVYHQQAPHPQHGDGDGGRDKLYASLCHNGAVDAVERILQQKNETRFGLQIGKCFDAETLDGGNRIDRLHQLGLQICTALHDATLVFLVQPVESPEDEQEQRGGCQRDECQFPRIDKHQTDGEEQDHQVHHQVERHIVDEVAYLYRIVHTRNDFAHTHRIEELLRQCKQMLIVAQYQGSINPLSGPQGKDAFHGTDKCA